MPQTYQPTKFSIDLLKNWKQVRSQLLRNTLLVIFCALFIEANDEAELKIEEICDKYETWCSNHSSHWSCLETPRTLSARVKRVLLESGVIVIPARSNGQRTLLGIRFKSNEN